MSRRPDRLAKGLGKDVRKSSQECLRHEASRRVPRRPTHGKVTPLEPHQELRAAKGR